MKKKLTDFGPVTAGVFIATISFNSFSLEDHITSGGVAGLAVSLKALLGWNTGNFVMISDFPLLIACQLFLGKETFVKTAYRVWTYSIFIKPIEGVPNLTDNPLLAALFGGIICGFGLGVVFWGNFSVGGTGIITQILHKYTPLPFAVTMTVVDGYSVAMGFVTFDIDTVIYSIIALIAIGCVVNSMQLGVTSSRNVMIVSPKNDLIEHYISAKADRGVTEISVASGYSGENHTILMTTVSRQEVPRLGKDIQKIDETAPIAVMPVTQVMGRGFNLKKYYRLDEGDIALLMQCKAPLSLIGSWDFFMHNEAYR